jgi:hypothetical protein
VIFNDAVSSGDYIAPRLSTVAAGEVMFIGRYYKIRNLVLASDTILSIGNVLCR